MPGHLPESAKPLFVAEVSRVGSDPFYWVRREAAFALGALAKVVSRDVVVDALVSYYVGVLMVGYLRFFYPAASTV